MGVVDGGRSLKQHGGVEIFKIILGIQIESSCLAGFSLLNIYITDSLMMEQMVCLKLLFILSLTIVNTLRRRIFISGDVEYLLVDSFTDENSWHTTIISTCVLSSLGFLCKSPIIFEVLGGQ